MNWDQPSLSQQTKRPLAEEGVKQVDIVGVDDKRDCFLGH